MTHHLALEFHAELPAASVIAAAVLLEYRPSTASVLTGFGARYASPLPAREHGPTLALIYDGQVVSRLTLPALPEPARAHCAAGPGRDPFDVAREWRVRLDRPITLAPGQRVQVVIEEAPPRLPQPGRRAAVRWHGGCRPTARCVARGPPGRTGVRPALERA